MFRLRGLLANRPLLQDFSASERILGSPPRTPSTSCALAATHAPVLGSWYLTVRDVRFFGTAIFNTGTATFVAISVTPFYGKMRHYTTPKGLFAIPHKTEISDIPTPPSYPSSPNS